MNNIQAASNRLANQLQFLNRQRAQIEQMEAKAKTKDHKAAVEFARLLNEDNIACINRALIDLNKG